MTTMTTESAITQSPPHGKPDSRGQQPWPEGTYASRLPAGELTKLMAESTVNMHYSDGSRIAPQHFLILRGVVKSTFTGPTKYLMPSGAFHSFHGPGDFLGMEKALSVDCLPDVTCWHEARTHTVSLLAIQHDNFRRFVSSSRAATHFTMVELSSRIQQAAIMQSRVSLPVGIRLRLFLTDLVRKFGVQLDNGTFALDFALSQQDIAEAIGASAPSVQLELRKLRTKNMISTGYRRLLVHWSP